MSRGLWITLSLVSGILMIVLGGLFVARPGASLATVLLLIGLFTIGYGVVLVVSGLMGNSESRAWLIAVGAVAALFGVIVLIWPGLTALTLLYLIAAWLLVTGAVEFWAAVRDRAGSHRIWHGLAGALSLVVGIWFIVAPGAGALALLWLIGVYLIALGIMRVFAAFMPPPGARTRYGSSRIRMA
ncbi:MAG: DUF308 domain-containing protein [Thermoleophilia bacterium]